MKAAINSEHLLYWIVPEKETVMLKKIFAHRGASAYAPENTLPAFEKAVDIGADGVELDIHLSRDGRLVVIHDEMLDRTTNGHGFVKDFTLAELKKLDASKTMTNSGFCNLRIPTLGEVYELLADTELLVNVEVKNSIFLYPGILEKALEAEAKYGMSGRVLYSSVNHYAMQELKRISPQSKTGLLYSTMLIDPWNAAMAANADALHPFFPCVANTPCMIPKCRKNGIAVNTWTVDEPEYIRAMFMLGVDSVITNKPDVAKSVRNELSNDAENTVN